MNDQKATTMISTNHPGHWFHALKLFSPLYLVIGLVTGCSTVAKPVYPTAKAGATASVLKIDNTMADSIWAMQMKAALGLKV